MTPPQRVQVFAVGLPAPGVPKDRRRYRVKWRVDGRDKTRAFKTRAEADRMRSRIQIAVVEGEQFDPASGLPASWSAAPAGPTWWSWSQEWLNLKWPQWSGHSRRTAVESLGVITPLMIRADAPAKPTDLADWLRHHGYRPGSPGWASIPSWLEAWSVPLADVNPALLETVLHGVSTKADGTPLVASVARRRRNTIGSILRSAVRRGILDADPMVRFEWRVPSASIAVDVALVPSPDDVEDIVDCVAELPFGSARYAALFATIGMAGLRPSEASGLRVVDLKLPGTGWGTAAVRGAITSPGTRYTADGTTFETKGLKQRPTDAVRDVPLPPSLVAHLTRHLAAWEPVDGRIFANALGRPVTTSNYGPIWVRARGRLWPQGHPLSKARVYDLRHSAATMMLRAGVPAAEVARRLGHSVDVLMRVYAGVFEDERDRSNDLIEQALAGRRTRRISSAR